MWARYAFRSAKKIRGGILIVHNCKKNNKFATIKRFLCMQNSPHISTMYRSGMKYNSIVATNSTKQARQDKNGTDQLNVLEKDNCV